VTNKSSPRASTGAFAFLAPLAIVLVALLAYSNGAAGVFVFDDHGDITDNVAIRQIWPPWRVVLDQGQSGVSGRPVVALGYALNYAWCGYETWGWHAVNVAVHVLTGLALLGCIRRALSSPPFDARWGGSATWIALAVALVWTAHPLATGVIMYRGQRVESMMALFFAATMYGALRLFAEPGSKRWARFAVIACALGTGCKEVIVGAPVLVLLYDALFVSRSWRAALAARRGFYGSLFGTWLLIAAWVALAQGRSESVGFHYSSMGVWDYLTTQAWAVPRYLRLSLWPHPLIFDFGKQPIVEVARWLPGALVVLVLLAATAWGLARRSGLAFLGAWWFVILAPSSSVLPIVTEVIVEHRAYLPSAAVLLLVALGVAAVLERVGGAARTAIASALVVATVGAGIVLTRARNETYHTEIGLWADTVAKLPENDRAHASYGNDLRVAGRIAEAGEHYAKAVELAPNDPFWRANLGTWLMEQGKLDESLAHLERAREIDPTFAIGLQSLAFAYLRKGEREKALEALLAALEHGAPAIGDVARQAAALCTEFGREADAIAALRSGVRQAPSDADLIAALARRLLEARDERLRDPAQAYALAQRASSLARGTDAELIELGARALAAQNRRREAAIAWKQAAEVWRVFHQPARAEAAERAARALDQSRP
jgi:tetratricopeptide (TPR) repeat protein